MNEIRSILVGSDLSEGSDEVVRAAGTVASLTGAELHVLHAFDLPSGASIRETSSPAATFPRRIEAAERALEEQLQRTLADGVVVGSRCVEIYVAHKAILDRAAAVDADLVVVGPHGHTRLADEVVGGTADRVIRSASVPCLVVRAPLKVPLRRVVAPVDRSSAALAALEAAMEWTLRLGGQDHSAELHVAHVLPLALNIPDFGLEPDAIEADLRGEVEEARARVAGAKDLHIIQEVRWGETALDEIIQLLGDPPADLAVLSTHGHGALKRFLVGSVASGLARRSPCPVLLVPPAMWRKGDRDDEQG